MPTAPVDGLGLFLSPVWIDANFPHRLLHISTFPGGDPQALGSVFPGKISPGLGVWSVVALVDVRADVLDEALVRRFTFKHYVKELSREEVEVLCRKFLTSVQYPIELGTVETITDAIYAKNKTPTVNDVVSSCTDNIIEWIITENKL